MSSISAAPVLMNPYQALIVIARPWKRGREVGAVDAVRRRSPPPPEVSRSRLYDGDHGADVVQRWQRDGRLLLRPLSVPDFE